MFRSLIDFSKTSYAVDHALIAKKITMQPEARCNNVNIVIV